jgi:peptidoglycan/LPS O-acetylase OafA/YrhL
VVSASSERRIPSLDGLRAISIAMVLLSHLAGTRNFPLRNLPVGELGVRVFFVISGFLITTLLLTEHGRTDDISLRRFYLRRTFRIFPAYYTYLVVIVLAAALGAVRLHPGDAAHAFTYTTNYHPDPGRAWWMGHTWSLAVEEQFYLLWPALLVALGPHRALRAALVFVIVSPVIRVIDFYAVPSWRGMQGESFWTIGDSIAIGCVLAGARTRLGASERWMRALRSPWFALVPIGVLATYMTGERYTLPSLVLLQTLGIAGIAACIDWALRFPAGRVGRVLNWRPVVFVGVMSYSLYLWQQPFFDRRDGMWIAVFPLNVVLASACALGSYFLVERTMLAVRERIEARWFSSRVPSAVPSEVSSPVSQPLRASS